MKIDDKIWEEIRYKMELYLASDTSLNSFLIEYQVRPTTGVPSILKFKVKQ